MNAPEFAGFLHKLEGVLDFLSLDQLHQVDEVIRMQLAEKETTLQVHRSILDAVARRTSPKTT